jgi:hypothetical protein
VIRTNAFEPVSVPRADRRRNVPASAFERELEIQAAIESLRAEQRRLEQLGFEIPLRRCHEELRYWSFISALHSLPMEAGRGSQS